MRYFFVIVSWVVENDVTVSGGWRMKGSRILWRQYKGLCNKCVTNGEGVSEIVKNCVTSFTDDPLIEFFSALLFALSRLLLQSEERDVLRISSVRSKIFRIRLQTSETPKIRLSCFRRREVDPAGGRGLRVSDVAAYVFHLRLQLRCHGVLIIS